MVQLEMPYPPSVNQYYRHVENKVLISREGRKYRELVVARVAEMQIEKFLNKVNLYIELFPPDNRRRDIDNVLKCLLDSFTKAGLYDDDCQVYKITVKKCEPIPPHGMVFVAVKPYEVE